MIGAVVKFKKSYSDSEIKVGVLHKVTPTFIETNEGGVGNYEEYLIEADGEFLVTQYLLGIIPQDVDSVIWGRVPCGHEGGYFADYCSAKVGGCFRSEDKGDYHNTIIVKIQKIHDKKIIIYFEDGTKRELIDIPCEIAFSAK